MKLLKQSENNYNDVLFQNIYGTWYAIMEVQGEVLYSALPEGIDPKSTRLEIFEVLEDSIERKRAA